MVKIRGFRYISDLLLKDTYQIPYLTLADTTQDCMENTFGVLKGLFGYENRPTPLDFIKRLDHFLMYV